MKGLSEDEVSRPSEQINDCVEHVVLNEGVMLWESVIPKSCVQTPGIYLGIDMKGMDTRQRRAMAVGWRCSDTSETRPGPFKLVVKKELKR